MSWSIIGVINEHLQKEYEENRNEKPEYFYASGLGSCKRKQVYKRLGTEPTNPPDERTLRLFKTGDIFHLWLQTISENAGVLIDKEKEIINEKYNYKGRYDALVEKDGVRLLYEFKTKHSMYFHHLETEGIPERYKLQVSSYVLMGKLKVDEARVLVISKDDLRTMEFPVNPMDYKDKVLQELIELNGYLERKELPARIKEIENNKPNWECRFCEYKDLCRGKDWENKIKKVVKKTK